MHIIYGYLLTVLSIAALPRTKPWLIGGLYLALGAGLEIPSLHHCRDGRRLNGRWCRVTGFGNGSYNRRVEA